MDKRDLDSLTRATAGVVREYVLQSMAPVLERLAALEARPMPVAKDGVGVAGGMINRDGLLILTLSDGRAVDLGRVVGKDGVDGVAVGPEVVAALVDDKVAEAISALPPPEPGRPGRDADPELIEQLIKAEVAKIPAPEPAKPGAPGRDAEVDPQMLDALIKAEVAKLPVPKDGEDGVGLAGAMIDRDECLVVTMTNGTVRNLGRVVGRDGDPGENGLDGLGFDDLEFEHDGERGFTLRFIRGDQVKEFPFAVPVVIDRGVFRDGTEYRHGDGVTYGGSFWIAQKDAPDGKPDGGNGAWRLAVKRGRDGKDGEKGERGDPGRPGKDGRDFVAGKA